MSKTRASPEEASDCVTQIGKTPASDVYPSTSNVFNNLRECRKMAFKLVVMPECGWTKNRYSDYGGKCYRNGYSAACSSSSGCPFIPKRLYFSNLCLKER